MSIKPVITVIGGDIKSIMIKVDDKLYALKEIEPPSPRRLIIEISENYNEDHHVLDLVKKRSEKRSDVFIYLFAKAFPNATKFSHTEYFFPGTLGWKYWIVGINEKHIEWAKAAKECGLIDGYIVDYAPGEEKA